MKRANLLASVGGQTSVFFGQIGLWEEGEHEPQYEASRERKVEINEMTIIG